MFTFCIQKVSTANPRPASVAPLVRSLFSLFTPTPLCLPSTPEQDTIRVEARDFHKDPVDAIREEIHRRYANKVSCPSLSLRRIPSVARQRMLPSSGRCIR